ncbi:MAG: TolB family protein [Fimbriimonadales bacterium]
MLKSRFPFTASSLALLVAAGCGGGSGGAGGGQTTTMGQVAITYTSNPQSRVGSTTGSVAVVGLAGAALTTVSFNPPPNIADTKISFLMGGEIRLYSLRDSSVATVPLSMTGIKWPAISGDGRLAFIYFDQATTKDQIYTCDLDGSHLTRVTANGIYHEQPSWSPDNTKLVFQNGTTNVLFTVSATGGSETSLAVVGAYPSWSPDGTRIAYDDTFGTVFTIPATGGTPTAMFGVAVATPSSTMPVWTPDSKSLVVSAANGPNRGACLVAADGTRNNLVLTTPPVSSSGDLFPSVAPDQSAIVVERLGTNVNLWTAPFFAGAPATRIVDTTPDGSSPEFPKWSPFLSNRTFVGTGASMGTTSAGILWSETGSSFASFLSFKASSATSSTITPQTSGGGADLIFLLKASSITSISYTNGYYLPPVTITAAAPQALVSYDASTGQVSMVAPLIVGGRAANSRAAGGDLMTFEGQFPAVYDGKGNNLAPSGASQVTLSSKTGKVVSYR